MTEQTHTAEEVALTPERFVNMLADMNEITAADFAARYPEFLRQREREAVAGWQGMEAAYMAIVNLAKQIRATLNKSGAA